MPERVNIIIGSDICPIRRNEKLFKAGDAKHIFNDLLGEFEQGLRKPGCPYVRFVCLLGEGQAPAMGRWTC